MADQGVPEDKSAEEAQATEQEAPQPLGDVVRSRGFLFGFIGWFLVLGTLWALATRGSFSTRLSFDAGFWGIVCLLPLSLLVIILLGARRRTRPVGAGLIVGFAASFLLVLLLGVSVAPACGPQPY